MWGGVGGKEGKGCESEEWTLVRLSVCYINRTDKDDRWTREVEGMLYDGGVIKARWAAAVIG